MKILNRTTSSSSPSILIAMLIACGMMGGFSLSANAAEENQGGIDAFMKLHFSDSMTTEDVVRILKLKAGSDTNYSLIREITYRVSNKPDLNFAVTDSDVQRLKQAGASEDLIA